MKNRASYIGLMVGLGAMLAGGTVAADGNQIAASQKSQTLASPDSLTLLSGLSGEKVCTTIVNVSEKTAVIQLTLTDDSMGSVTSTIAKGKSSALCEMDAEMVEVECLGPRKCAFTWSVDRF
ncbi:MAG: hypothetical protein GY944_18735 [bacterium]|nr:hypothetical protein [bacterium]